MFEVSDTVLLRLLFGYLVVGIFALILLTFMSAPAHAKVYLNELMPNPSSGSDWIEIYADSDTDISGWVIKDTAKSDVYVVPDGTFVGPGYSKYKVFDCGSRLNKVKDTIYLHDQSGSEVDKYSYMDELSDDVSFGRFPDGESWMQCSPTYESQNNECRQEDVAPVQKEEPTRSQSAILTIEEVKNDKGALVSNARIYIDGNYIHHYAPENIKFCDGCDCGGYANCGLGSHHVSVEKSGYESWSRDELFQNGDVVVLTPVLMLSNITQTPSLKETPYITVKQNTPTVSFTFSSTDSSRRKVLGIGIQNETTNNTDNSKKEVSLKDGKDGEISKPVLPGLFLIVGGLIFIFAAAYPIIFKNGLKWDKWVIFKRNEN